MEAHEVAADQMFYSLTCLNTGVSSTSGTFPWLLWRKRATSITRSSLPENQYKLIFSKYKLITNKIERVAVALFFKSEISLDYYN
jgi:hypothetical protein